MYEIWIKIALSSDLWLDLTAQPQRFSARKDLILSAGAVATPQILMLSGIGDRTRLSSHNIKPIVNLPDVGQQLQDHPYFALQWSVNSTNTFDNVLFNSTAFNEAMAEYGKAKKGLFANNAIANHIGFFRLAKNSSVLKRSHDPSAGPKSPHYEFAFSVSQL